MKLFLLATFAVACTCKSRSSKALIDHASIVVPGHPASGARNLQEGAAVRVTLKNAATGGRLLDNGPSAIGKLGALGNVVTVTVADNLGSIGAGNRSSVWVGLYSPADSDPRSTTPIRYQSLIWSPSWLGPTRTASLNFTLSNLHTGGYVAYVFLGGTASSGPSGPNTVPEHLLDQAGLSAQAPGFNGLAGQLTSMSSGKKPFVSVTGALPPSLAALPPANVKHNFHFGGLLLGSSMPDWPLSFVLPNEPTHVRVTVGAAPTIFTWSWNQLASSSGGFLELYNASTGAALARRLSASRSSITVNMTCANSAASTTGWRDMGTTWSVTANLAMFAGQVIAYRLGDLSAATAFPPDPAALLFSVPPYSTTVAVPSGGVSYLLFADMGFGVDNTTDQGWQGANINDGKAALAIARRAALHARGVASPAVSAVLIAGDLAYADGYLGQWEEWFEMMQAAIARVPLLYNVGNHEADFSANRAGKTSYSSPDGQTQPPSYLDLAPTGPLGTTTQAYPGYPEAFASMTVDEETNSISSGGECGLISRLLPTSYATPAAPWYAARVGPLLLIAISSEHNTTVGSPQYAWLAAVLAGVNRAETPWVLTHTHRNMYITMSPCTTTGVLNAGSVGAGQPGGACQSWQASGSVTNPNLWASEATNMLLLQQNLEPLLLAAGVNVHFAGHTHLTQRQCAAAEGVCVRNSTQGVGGAPDLYDFSAGVALNYTSPRTGSTAVLPYVPVYYTISNGGANPDAVANTVAEGNAGGNGAIGFSGAMFSAPNWAYSVVTVVSPTVLEVRIMDAFTGAVIDFSRIVQPAWPVASQPTAFFSIANSLSLPAAVGVAASASTEALTGLLFGLRCDIAAASGLPLAATALATVAPGAAASADVAAALSAAMVAANALTNCSLSPAGLPVVPIPCTASGSRRTLQAASGSTFLTASFLSAVDTDNAVVAAAIRDMAAWPAVLSAYAAAAASSINAAVVANALTYTNGELSVMAEQANYWAFQPFAAASTSSAVVTQLAALAASPSTDGAGFPSTSQALGLGLGIGLSLLAIIITAHACSAAMRSQGAGASASASKLAEAGATATKSKTIATGP